MSTEYKVITKGFVKLSVTSTGSENKITDPKYWSKDETVRAVKGKLEMMTGASPDTMSVKVYDSNDKFICQLTDDSALLGSYPIDDDMRIEVDDKFLLRKTLEDESNVEKYEMAREEYDKRDDTLKAYLEKNKLGKYSPEEITRREAERKQEEEDVARMKAGSRCLVSVPGQPSRRAEVMYVGKTEFKPGWWIGVKYDEPLGKNDGSVNGKQYFECPPKYGGFVKPAHIEIGDFPEEDLGLSDEL